MLKFYKNFGPSLDPMIPDETKIIKNISISLNLNLLKILFLLCVLIYQNHVSLIGFAGAPWTLACYMIEGKGSKDFINTRKALWSEK